MDRGHYLWNIIEEFAKKEVRKLWDLVWFSMQTIHLLGFKLNVVYNVKSSI